MATYQGQALAAIMAFKRGNRAWYFYGASNDQERNRMPTYLLQWQAMRWAAQAGCNEYDLWGVPDADEEVLETQFTQRSDGLWGVYRFKRGFGGEVKRTAGVYAKVLRPAIYRLYLTAVKIRKAVWLAKKPVVSSEISSHMDKQDWNQIIGNFPQPSLLQTWEWGEVKNRHG